MTLSAVTLGLPCPLPVAGAATFLAACALQAALPSSGPQPVKPAVREYAFDGVTLRLFARSFSQGEAVYLELLADTSEAAPVVRYEGRPVHVSRRAWGWRGFFAIPPDSAPGERTLTVGWPAPDTPHWRCTLTVAAARFAVSRTAMDVGRYSDVDHARDPAVQRFIAECAAKKEKAFARRGADMVSGPFALPRDPIEVTSPFWSSRVYERYRMENGRRVPLPPSRKTHRGLDLRGARGEPVYAMADGEVALADSLYYEGKLVILDHGNRVMSYYMHLDSLLVAAGQQVRAGEQIATVGATGVATAAHLHVSVLIEGVQVDPLSLPALPVRE